MPRFEVNRATARMTAGVVLLALVAGGLATPVLAADPVEVVYSSTGTEKQFVVPDGVTSIHVVLIGGQGGNNLGGLTSGRGARTTGDLAVTAGATLAVEVGGNGINGGGSAFNGGGSSYAGGGGGASDLRTIPHGVAGSLASRLVVAAGGGGVGNSANGGDAGNAGADAVTLGGGGDAGTASSGGAGGLGSGASGADGTSGTGGEGGYVVPGSASGGGGGAGLYGGGGGGCDCGGGGSGSGAGGGGGSSYTGSASNASVTLDNTGIPSITISYVTSPPVISGLAPVHGSACAGCTIDVYSVAANLSKRFEGTTTANGAGAWSYPGLVLGPSITATATSGEGTSAFATPYAFPTPPFTDIGSSSFQTEIAWLYANGVTAGCTATAYCPTAAVTREQMASFLARALRLPATATDYFSDDDGTTHEANINRIAAAGITTGCAPGLYCPTGLVLRDQMASFLARAVGLTVGAGRDYFSDDDGNTHEANIDRAAAAGIASGCSSYLYCPGSSVTREQMAAFLRRLIAPVAPPPYPAP